METEDQKRLRDTLWDTRARKGYGTHSTTPFFEKFLKKYRNRIGPRVLDIGCGTGIYAVRLAKEGFTVTGIDPSEEMRMAAEKVAAASKVTVRILPGESVSLPFERDSFDTIVTVGAVHHNLWRDIETSFAEIARVLRPGGLLFFQVRAAGDTVVPREQIADYGYTASDLTGDRKGVFVHYFTEEELLKLGEQHGLTVVMGPRKRSQEWRGDPSRHKVRLSVVYQRN